MASTLCPPLSRPLHVSAVIRLFPFYRMYSTFVGRSNLHLLPLCRLFPVRRLPPPSPPIVASTSGSCTGFVWALLLVSSSLCTVTYGALFFCSFSSRVGAVPPVGVLRCGPRLCAPRGLLALPLHPHFHVLCVGIRFSVPLAAASAHDVGIAAFADSLTLLRRGHVW
jgi:hypothetical protein